jgi:hypothetical protein
VKPRDPASLSPDRLKAILGYVSSVHFRDRLHRYMSAQAMLDAYELGYVDHGKATEGYVVTPAGRKAIGVEEG